MQCMRMLALLLLLVLPGTAQQQNPDIFLITIDTLRADRVMGEGAVTGKGLGRLAADGINFTQAFTPAPLTNTSHASILTGLFPRAHGVHDFGVPLSSSTTTIAEVLTTQGYRTAAFIGALVLDSKTLAPGLGQGFDTYLNFPGGSRESPRWGRLERRAEAVVAEAEAWLRQNPSGPRFVWIHLYDPHDPYEPPEPFASQYRGRQYDGEVAYADAVIAAFLEFLDSRNWYRDAVVITVGDHGEGLGEHGEDTHGILLYDSTLHVPLLIKLPQAEQQGKTIASLVRTVDLFATMAELAGAAVPKNDGDSLRPLWSDAALAPRNLIAETQYPLRFGWAPLHGLRTDEHKLIEAPRAEFYDLRRDPGERQNLYEPWNEQVATLRAALAQYRESSPAAQPANSRVPESTLSELKALGYLGNDPGVTKVPEPSLLPDPKDRIAVHNALHAGMMAEAAGSNAAAMESFRRAAALEPGSFLAQSQLGLLELRSQDFKSAAVHLTNAFRLRPSDASVAFALGEAMFALNDSAGAREALDAGLKVEPRRYEARVKLGEVEAALGKLYLERGELTKAIAPLRRAVRKAPENKTAKDLLAQAESGGGKKN